MAKNIFVSHSWRYTDDYDRLMALLERKNHFSYTDYSVKKSNPRDRLSDVESAVQYCSVFVFIAGVYCTCSDSIQKEINWAKKYNKPILLSDLTERKESQSLRKMPTRPLVGVQRPLSPQ